MPAATYEVAHVSEIATPAPPEPGESLWRAVRMHFGIGSFGISAYVAESAGEAVVSEHDERSESETEHEELFYVASGHATFRVGGETVEAPAGTFVYVRDPGVKRGATAREPGTTVVVVGGTPGRAFAVSPWERKYTDSG